MSYQPAQPAFQKEGVQPQYGAVQPPAGAPMMNQQMQPQQMQPGMMQKPGMVAQPGAIVPAGMLPGAPQVYKEPPNGCFRCCFPMIAIACHQGCDIDVVLAHFIPCYALCCWKPKDAVEGDGCCDK